MKVKVKVKSLSRVLPSATPWTAAYQASPSMGFSRQEYWSGVPLPSPANPWSKLNHFAFTNIVNVLQRNRTKRGYMCVFRPEVAVEPGRVDAFA